jgi:hypothetical protein
VDLPATFEAGFGRDSVLCFRCATLSLGNSEGLPGGAALRNSSSFGLLEHPMTSVRIMVQASGTALVKRGLVIDITTLQFKGLNLI